MNARASLVSARSAAEVGKSRLRGCARAFTLVELLVVVAILLTVAVLALPSVTSLSKNAARRGAVLQVMGVLDQARALALSQNVTVFVAFADGSDSIPAPYRFRSYAIFREVYYPELRADPAGPYRLEQVQQWTLLPEGVALRATSAEGCIFEGPRKSFYFRMASRGSGSSGSGLEVNLPYLRFNAVGTLEREGGATWLARAARLALFEGFVEANNTQVTTTQRPDDVVLLSTVTGRAKREERLDGA